MIHSWSPLLDSELNRIGGDEVQEASALNYLHFR